MTVHYKHTYMLSAHNDIKFQPNFAKRGKMENYTQTLVTARPTSIAQGGMPTGRSVAKDCIIARRPKHVTMTSGHVQVCPIYMLIILCYLIKRIVVFLLFVF